MLSDVLPDTYLIGAPKAGTTSLASWLGAHPDLYFSQPKEPAFWASDFPQVRRTRGFETQAAYEQLFESPAAMAAQRRAEGSTTYLYSREAVSAIVHQVDDPRFIVALRNPVDIVLSFHRTQRLRLNEDELNFADAWKRSQRGELPETDVLDPKLVDYPRVGRLGAAVEHVLHTAGRQSVHFVRFEELRDDPVSAWYSLLEFLELRADVLPDFSVHNSSNRMYRSRALHRFRHRPPAMLEGPIRRLRHRSLRSTSPTLRRVKHALWWHEEPKPAMSQELRRELTTYFADDVQLLSDLTGADLTAWTMADPTGMGA